MIKYVGRGLAFLNAERICSLAFGVILVSSALGKHLLGGPSKSVKYYEEVSVGLDAFRLNECCYVFVGFARAEQFFRGLERVPKGDGWEFKKAGRPIEYFPDSFVVDIEAHGMKCTDAKGQDVCCPKVESLLDSATFVSSWQTGLKKRNAELASVEKYRTPMSELAKPPIHILLTIRSKNVPLSDALTLEMVDKDGRRMASFCLRL